MANTDVGERASLSARRRLRPPGSWRGVKDTGYGEQPATNSYLHASTYQHPSTDRPSNSDADAYLDPHFHGYFVPERHAYANPNPDYRAYHSYAHRKPNPDPQCDTYRDRDADDRFNWSTI